jgi:hypothetical protein
VNRALILALFHDRDPLLPACLPWLRVRKRSIPTERLSRPAKLVPTFAGRCVTWLAQRMSTVANLGFMGRSRYCFIQVAPYLRSRGGVDPIPDPLLLRESFGAGNRTRELRICLRRYIESAAVMKEWEPCQFHHRRFASDVGP